MKPSGICAPSRPLRVCRASTSSVIPASRSSSFSPTHMMGRRPAAKAAFTLRATISSVSPNWWRRSEWPMIAYWASSATIWGPTSPVAATSSSQWTSCEPNLSDEPRSAPPTAARYTNGGHTTFSTPSRPSIASHSPFANASALSSRVWHFQFAAATGVLPLMLQSYLRPSAANPLRSVLRQPAGVGQRQGQRLHRRERSQRALLQRDLVEGVAGVGPRPGGAHQERHRVPGVRRHHRRRRVISRHHQHVRPQRQERRQRCVHLLQLRHLAVEVAVIAGGVGVLVMHEEVIEPPPVLAHGGDG